MISNSPGQNPNSYADLESKIDTTNSELQTLNANSTAENTALLLELQSEGNNSDTIIAELRKQTGYKGFDTIVPGDNAVVGSWYLIVPEEDTVFTSLIENTFQCVGAAVGAADRSRIVAATVTSKGINIPAIAIKANGEAGTGFTTIHLSSGRVKAYRK